MTEKVRDSLFSKRKVLILIVILWVHITLLDLIIVTPKGAKILWQDSLKMDTIITHSALVCLSALIFVGLNRCFNYLASIKSQ